MQSLCVVDVLGATGDYTVFNDDFETVGFLNMKDTSARRTGPDYGNDRPFPNFGNSSLWEASNSELSSVLGDIVGQIAAQLKTGEEIDNDPEFEEFDEGGVDGSVSIK